jgi:hypothetical protein
MASKVTPINVLPVLVKLAKMAERDKGLCGDIDAFLDAILKDDGFGTEGQLDPRDDRRWFKSSGS